MTSWKVVILGLIGIATIVTIQAITVIGVYQVTKIASNPAGLVETESLSDVKGVAK